MSGATKAAQKGGNTVQRHGVWTVLEHWAIALSGLLLLFTGFGQMPMYSRYMVDRLPGLAWASDYSVTFRIHLWAGAVFTAAVVFHVVRNLTEGGWAIWPRRGDVGASARILWAILRRKPEPPSHKFLAEQRLAYAFIGGVTLVLVVTGVLKVLKNLGTLQLPYGVIVWNTLFHNVATVFFLLGFFAHLGAFVVKANRPLLRAMFTGRVRRAYALHRHPLWIEGGEDAGPARRRLDVRDGARLLQGTLGATGLLLGAAVAPAWYALALVVVLSQMVTAFTGRCPLEASLRRLGFPAPAPVPIRSNRPTGSR